MPPGPKLAFLLVGRFYQAATGQIDKTGVQTVKSLISVKCTEVGNYSVNMKRCSLLLGNTYVHRGRGRYIMMYAIYSPKL